MEAIAMENPAIWTLLNRSIEMKPYLCNGKANTQQ
jgi:hypothetical protein